MTNIVRRKDQKVTLESIVSSGKAADILCVSHGTMARFRSEIPHTERKLKRTEYVYRVADLLAFAKDRNLVIDHSQFETNTGLFLATTKEASTNV